MSLILKVLKATRARVISVNNGLPSILGGMNIQGVTGARLGKTELQVPFDVFFDLPLPFANIPFNAPTGDLGSGGVWAFPLHGTGQGEGAGGFEPAFHQYRKPKYPKGS